MFIGRKISRAEKMASKIFKLMLIMHIAVICVCAQIIENSKGTDKEAESPKLVSNHLKDSEKIVWSMLGWPIIIGDSENSKLVSNNLKDSEKIVWSLISWPLIIGDSENSKLVSNNLKDSENN
ncbi:uncharacterized protein LOC120337616 [Styela clava]